MNDTKEFTDEKLVEITTEIDDFIGQLIEKYDIHVCDLSGLILARAVLANEYVGTDVELKDMMKQIIKMKHLPEPDSVFH